MKKIISLIAFGFGVAHAGIIATPQFYDFGSVKSGQMRSTQIRFYNTGPLADRSFHASCSGDLSAYDCVSNCFGILGMGQSCLVSVRFAPRNGDGLQKSLYIQGFGQTGFANANLTGVDAKE